MFKDILVPIDLNEESSWRKAVPVAVELARAHKRKLHLMTVVPSYGSSFVGSFFPADFEKKAVAETTSRLKELTDEIVPDDVPVDRIVGRGTIYEEIVKARQALGDDCDLIVMASHRPGLEDYLIGPNAARVLRHSRVSVLVVRE